MKITTIPTEIMTHHKIYPNNCNTIYFLHIAQPWELLTWGYGSVTSTTPEMQLINTLASSSSDSCWNKKHRYAQLVGCCARCWSQDTIENRFPDNAATQLELTAVSQPAEDYLHCILLYVDWISEETQSSGWFYTSLWILFIYSLMIYVWVNSVLCCFLVLYQSIIFYVTLNPVMSDIMWKQSPAVTNQWRVIHPAAASFSSLVLWRLQLVVCQR